jgi:hypothetical protein
LPFLWSKKPSKQRGRAYSFPPPSPPGGGGGGKAKARPRFLIGKLDHKKGKNDPPVFNQALLKGGPPGGGPPQPEKEPILARILRDA